MRQLSTDDFSSEFERNYEYYRQRMERRLVRQVYDRGRFDDICQDTFVKAWTYFARPGAKLPQTDYHLGNLLADMAVKVAIDDYRKNKSKDYLPLSEIEDTQLSELMDEGHDNWICNREEFQEAIAQLKPKQQDVVQLMRQGYKKKKIAEILEIRPSAVSEILRDVKTQLRKYYPVTADLKRVYEGMDIERLLKNIHKYEHERLLRGTVREQLDDLSEFKKSPGWQYTREQVRYIDQGQFGTEVFGSDPLIIDFVYPDDNDDVVLVARPSELVIVRGVKRFRNFHGPTQPWGKTISTKQITTRPTIEVN